MKYAIIIALLYSGSAFALPDELHSCMAWMTLYDQTHDNQKITNLRVQLEAEMKKAKVFNPLQYDEALHDKATIQSATTDGRDTSNTLSYCSKIAYDFVH